MTVSGDGSRGVGTNGITDSGDATRLMVYRPCLSGTMTVLVRCSRIEDLVAHNTFVKTLVFCFHPELQAYRPEF